MFQVGEFYCAVSEVVSGSVGAVDCGVVAGSEGVVGVDELVPAVHALNSASLT